MLGAVDVGTNTVRLLIGRTVDGKVAPDRHFRRVTRLGGGFRADAGLAPEAMARTLDALREIASLLRENDVRTVRAVGTEILRAAGNGTAFTTRVEKETGLHLEVIDGMEEARLSARGALSALDPRPTAALIVDIGGGSTEFVLWCGTPLFHRSYPLGVVRLAEAPSEPAWHLQIDSTLADLREELIREGLWSTATAPDCLLVGTAGTVTTLAALHLGMAEYDWRRVNNLVLPAADLHRLQVHLAPLSAAGREALPGMEQGRGDLIVPGLRIVLALLELFQRPALTVSDFGLLEGVLLDLAATDRPRKD